MFNSAGTPRVTRGASPAPFPNPGFPKSWSGLTCSPLCPLPGGDTEFVTGHGPTSPPRGCFPIVCSKKQRELLLGTRERHLSPEVTLGCRCFHGNLPLFLLGNNSQKSSPARGPCSERFPGARGKNRKTERNYLCCSFLLFSGHLFRSLIPVMEQGSIIAWSPNLGSHGQGSTLKGFILG